MQSAKEQRLLKSQLAKALLKKSKNMAEECGQIIGSQAKIGTLPGKIA